MKHEATLEWKGTASTTESSITNTAVFARPLKNPRGYSRNIREFAKVGNSELMNTWFFSHLRLVAGLLSMKTMLKIQRTANGKVVFTLSGRIEVEDVAELQRLFALEAEDRHLVLDLNDVTLVDRGAVKFLARCEQDSIKLENCPPYIREWIERERAQKGQRER